MSAHDRILVTGASGSGTTTLGRALARHLTLPFFDADDYFWVRSEPPYQDRREREARLALLGGDLRHCQGYIVAGSIVGWGEEIEYAFTLIVFLTLSAAIRVERLRQRELARFGKISDAFLARAEHYDDGSFEQRSLALHEQWLATRTCPVLRLDGDLSVHERLDRVVDALNDAC